MDCFFLFDLHDGKITFHAEYCTERAVHTVDGIVDDGEKLYRAAGVANDKILSFLTARFASNNGLFSFLDKNGVPYTITGKEYVDTSSDV